MQILRRMNNSTVQEMLDKVLKTISDYKLVEKGDNVLAAVSGGPDSVCLLHILYSLSNKLDIKLHAIHINHGLRGEESDGDEEYTRRLCEKLGINMHVFNFDVNELANKWHMSLEVAGREVRYREFEKLADSLGAARIAVAHNMNDQAETILMNMIRGTGLQGLCGMEFKRDRIIRPLLNITRVEIERYCLGNDLNPRIDSTNLEDEFSRNKIRLDIIPSINKSFGCDLNDSLNRMSKLVKNDNSFLEESATHAFENCHHEIAMDAIYLSIDKITRLHSAIMGRVIRIAVKKVKGDLNGIESGHIDDIVSLILKGRTGSMVQLPKGIRAGVSYSFLKIYSDKFEEEKVYFDIQLAMPGSADVHELQISVNSSVSDRALMVDKYCNMGYNSLVQFFDYDKLYKGINIRNRREGDRFSPFGSKGTKKLKEYLIDVKIPREKRDRIPLITYGNEVVWIIGYRTSDKFKVTDNTKNILRLEVKEKEGEHTLKID